jgi:hypothetical protein
VTTWDIGEEARIRALRDLLHYEIPDVVEKIEHAAREQAFADARKKLEQVKQDAREATINEFERYALALYLEEQAMPLHRRWWVRGRRWWRLRRKVVQL